MWLNARGCLLALMLASCAGAGAEGTREAPRGDLRVCATGGDLLQGRALADFVGDARVLLLGEHHGFRENLDLALRIFLRLNETAGFNRIALEISCTDAAGLNEYLETGNEFFLLDTALFSEPTPANSVEFLEFFRALRRARAVAPPERRFSVWGIDLPARLPQSVRGQIAGRIGLLPEGNLKEELSSALAGSGPIGEEHANDLLRALQGRALDQGETGPASELRFFLELLVRSFRLWRSWPESWYRERDRIMFELLRRGIAEEADPGAVRVMVLCGARHARKRPAWPGEVVLGAQLDGEGSPVAGKVRSVLIQPLDTGPILADPPLAVLAGSVGEGEALFLPLGAGGPETLRNPARFPALLLSDAPALLGDFYDAAMLFRGGKAVTPRD